MVYLYEHMELDEYLDEVDRVTTENEVASLFKELTILEMKHEASLRDIELKVLMENYTEDDLTAMYTHEMELYTEAEEGIINKIIEYFRNIIKAIFNIKPDVSDVKPDDEIELPINPKEGKNVLSKIGEMFTKVISIKKENGDINKLKAAAEAAIAATGIAGAIKLFKTKTKVKGDEIKELPDAITELAKEGNQQLDKIKEVDPSVADTIKGYLDDFLGGLNECLKKVNIHVSKNNGDDSSNNTEGTPEKTDNKDDGKGDSGSPDNKGGEPNKADNNAVEKMCSGISKAAEGCLDKKNGTTQQRLNKLTALKNRLENEPKNMGNLSANDKSRIEAVKKYINDIESKVKNEGVGTGSENIQNQEQPQNAEEPKQDQKNNQEQNAGNTKPVTNDKQRNNNAALAALNDAEKKLETHKKKANEANSKNGYSRYEFVKSILDELIDYRDNKKLYRGEDKKRANTLIVEYKKLVNKLSRFANGNSNSKPQDNSSNQNNANQNTTDVSDTSENKDNAESEDKIATGNDAVMKKEKKSVKSEMIKRWKNLNPKDHPYDKSVGNKIKLSDMKAITSSCENILSSGKAQSGSAKVTPEILARWKKVIKWMEANNINESVIDDEELNELIMMVESVDDVVLERCMMGLESVDGEDFEMTLESFLASHPDPIDKTDVDELSDLADLL